MDFGSTPNGKSVFTTELLTIVWALRWMEDIRPNKVVICSDSAAALMSLREAKSKARPDFINEIFLSVLFRIGRTDCEVKFCWVPGNAGVEGSGF